MKGIPKKNFTLLTICLSLAFLFTLFGTSFAYLSTKLIKNKSNSSNESYGINVEYKSDDNTINLENKDFQDNAISANLNFSVQSTSKNEKNINIMLKNVNNNFCQKVNNYEAEDCNNNNNSGLDVSNEVKYTLYSCIDNNYEDCENLISNNYPTANNIIKMETIPANKTKYYKFTVSLIKADHLQNYNQNKKLKGELIIKEKEIKKLLK